MEEGRKGYVPVLVGKGGYIEKIWIPIKAIRHPTIVELLDQSVDEFGYQQGVLRIIYDANNFKAVIDNASKKYLANYKCI
ncbi:Auxin-induced protein, ARG7 [Spatholobus suberectus]|nr:Auxin-induced protein, ARG7 [Spatholobus suberectus]